MTREPVSGRHRNCVPGMPRHVMKRRLGTIVCASRGLAASGSFLASERARSRSETLPSLVTVWWWGSAQYQPAELCTRVLRVRPGQTPTPDALAGDNKSGTLDGYQFLCLSLPGSEKKTTRLGVVITLSPQI
jgi:hypothetical protein